jgi:uncharacterized protein DUF4440
MTSFTRIRRSIVFSLLLSNVASMGQNPAPPTRIVTTTRLVAIFSQMEADWLRATQQKDQATLQRLLAEDFQVWTPAPPGEPLPREQWFDEILAEKLDSFRIRQMAVRGLNDSTAVVSFVLSQTVVRAGHRHTSDFFIVDLWRKIDESWQATDRYSSPIRAVSAGRQEEVKPTGKD